MDPTGGFLTPERLSLIGLLSVSLLIVIRAFTKGWIHTDAEFQRERDRGDKWEALAIELMRQRREGLAVTRQAVKVAEKSLDVVTNRTTDDAGGGSPS